MTIVYRFLCCMTTSVVRLKPVVQKLCLIPSIGLQVLTCDLERLVGILIIISEITSYFPNVFSKRMD